MTTFYLVRHAIHDLVDKCLIGRTEVSLNDAGRLQAVLTAERLSKCGITAVQSSPRLRARETAEVIGSRLGLPVQTVCGMDEIDFGEWTGRSFEELDADPLWKLWNAARAVAQTPGGETAGAVQQRVLDHLVRVAAADPSGRIVVVSHGEPIRAVLLSARGLSLNEWWRIPVEPATIKTAIVRGSKIVASEGRKEGYLRSRRTTSDHAGAGA